MKYNKELSFAVYIKQNDIKKHFIEQPQLFRLRDKEDKMAINQTLGVSKKEGVKI